MFDDLIPKTSGMFDDLIPKSNDVGRGSAFLTGAKQGLTFNLADEYAGLQGASGMPPNPITNAFSGPSNALIGLAKLGYGYLSGGDEAAKRYEASRDEYRNQVKAAETQYPGTTLAGNIAGALALPLGGALNAPTLAARIGRGAGVGAVTGGLAGAGEGTSLEDRASRAAVGTGLGALAGGAGVPVVEGAARGVGYLAAKPIEMLRSAMNPTGAAERAIGRAYREAAETDPNAINRLAPNELTPGGPQTVMDTLGAPGRDLARSAANLSGGARDTLNQTLDPRFEGQANRLTNWLRGTFNFPDAHAQQEAITTAARTTNRPAYSRAYQEGDREIWSPELERLTAAPYVMSALNSAMSKWKNYAVRDGYGAANPPFRVENGGLIRTGGGMQAYPNIQLWDYAARELQDAARAAPIGSQTAGLYNDLARALKTELDRIVPTYRTAREGAAGFFRAENALEAGQNFVMENFATQQTRAALARMSPGERQLFQDGFVSRLVETLEKVPDRADVVRRIYNTPAAREKIQLALGPQRASELEAVLRIENVMQQSLRGVQGNSTTVQQLIGSGLAGGAAGAAGGGFLGYDPSTSGIVAALAAGGKRYVDTRVATRVAEMLTSNDPAILNRGVRMVASNQTLMSALRSADSAAARVGGGQSQTVTPALQLPSYGRADDEPKIPRPPGQ